jgi:gliding motility-associated-like protein
LDIFCLPFSFGGSVIPKWIIGVVGVYYYLWGQHRAGWLVKIFKWGQNLDECDFSICASTIPAQASEGNSYGRAYAATLTTGEGIGNIDWTLNDAPISESGYLIYPVEFGLYGVNLQISPSCNTVLEVVTGTIPVWIPNAVTFGEDGVNDTWGVFGELSALESFEVQVFNRWGQKVFETNDIEQRWTGSAFDGAYFVPDGIYLYIVTLKFPWEIENRQYKGHITLLR